ncbi:MAG: hypothetical protein ACNA7Q_04225 [Rhodobacterales bacterium]
MMKRIKAMIEEDRGVISADWITLSGGVMVLMLVLVGTVQQEISPYTSKIQPMLNVTSAFE